MNQKSVFSTTLLGLSLAFLSSCSQNPAQDSATANPMEVPVIKLETSNGVISKNYTSSIEGVVNVEIRPQVSGYLYKIFVDEGATVKKGQALFQVDDRMYREQFNTAQSAILAAKANLANIKIDLDRKKELVNNNLVSALQVEQAQASYDAAKAAVAQAVSALESAKINLEFCTIKAPVDGVIGRIPYRLGSLIGPTAVSPLTILSDTHAVYAYFSMSETDFVNFQDRLIGANTTEKLKGALPVTLLTASGQEFSQKGKIDAVEGQFDKNTGSITLRARFENPNGELRTGNTGKIVINEEVENVLLVPVSATTAVQDKIFAFTIDKEGKAVQTPIEVSGKQGGNYFVRSGLQSGDQIITNGLNFLQNGMPVTVKSTVAKEAAAKDSLNKS